MVAQLEMSMWRRFGATYLVFINVVTLICGIGITGVGIFQSVQDEGLADLPGFALGSNFDDDGGFSSNATNVTSYSDVPSLRIGNWISLTIAGLVSDLL